MTLLKPLAIATLGAVLCSAQNYSNTSLGSIERLQRLKLQQLQIEELERQAADRARLDSEWRREPGPTFSQMSLGALETNDMTNGRWWNAIDEVQRLGFLIGLRDGGALNCPASSLGELREGLLALYRLPENRRVPVRYAASVYCAKAAGMDPIVVERAMASFRKAASGLAPDARSFGSEEKAVPVSNHQFSNAVERR